MSCRIQFSVRRFVMVGLAVFAILGAAATARAALVSDFSFTTNASDAITGGSAVLYNGATISGGNLTLSNTGQTGTSGQYADITADVSTPLMSLTACTFEAYVNINSLAAWQRVYEFGAIPTTSMFLTPSENGTKLPQAAITVSGSESDATSATATTTGSHYFAVTFSPSGANFAEGLYVDGSLAVMQTTTLTPSSMANTSQDYLGASQSSNPNFQGTINEFRIWNTALSASQIAADYAAGPNGVAVWNGSGDFAANPANWDLQLSPSGSMMACVNSGSLTISASQNYAGGTLIQSGTVTVGNLGTLGSGSIVNNASLFFSRSDNFTLNNAISGSGGLCQLGSGTLTLTGSSTYTGATAVAAGTLQIPVGGLVSSTAQVTVGSTVGSNAVLSLSGGGLTSNNVDPSVNIGTAANTVGSFNMSGGTLNATSEIWIGNGSNTAYGALTMSGGTANVGSWFCIGHGGNGVFNISGGILAVTGNYLAIDPTGANTKQSVNLSGTSLVNSSSAVFLPDQGTGNFAVMSVSGSAALNVAGPAGIEFGVLTNSNTGILNLNGGTTTTTTLRKGSGTGIYLVDFNGGTLRANTGASSSFLTGLSGAYVYGGGLTIDSNNQNITIGQALLAPSGSGVSLGSLAVSGSGYSDTPIVSIAGGGGSGATAVANINYASGTLTSIAITNPGMGYNSSPTFSLIGGGGSGSITGTALLTANPSGGLTKVGAGTLTLSASNTYGGTTVINAGTLKIGTAKALPVGGSLDVAAAGSFDLGGFDGQIGSLSGAGVVTNSGSAASNTLTVNGSSMTTFSGTIQNGAISVTALAVSGSGTLLLTGSNSYSGGTYVNSGTLIVAANGALPGGTSLAVAAGGTLVLDSSAGAGPMAGSPIEASADGVLAVPEPGAITLLLAAFCSTAIYCRFRRPKAF